jgi:hypothetical protein
VSTSHVGFSEQSLLGARELVDERHEREKRDRQKVERMKG